MEENETKMIMASFIKLSNGLCIDEF